MDSPRPWSGRSREQSRRPWGPPPRQAPTPRGVPAGGQGCVQSGAACRLRPRRPAGPGRAPAARPSITRPVLEDRSNTDHLDDDKTLTPQPVRHRPSFNGPCLTPLGCRSLPGVLAMDHPGNVGRQGSFPMTVELCERLMVAMVVLAAVVLAEKLRVGDAGGGRSGSACASCTTTWPSEPTGAAAYPGPAVMSGGVRAVAGDGAAV
jgi:hypothetical protein